MRGPMRTLERRIWRPDEEPKIEEDGRTPGWTMMKICFLTMDSGGTGDDLWRCIGWVMV